MMADFFGIYGTTVVIDHGYGLLSLYGHLRSFAAAATGRRSYSTIINGCHPWAPPSGGTRASWAPTA